MDGGSRKLAGLLCSEAGSSVEILDRQKKILDLRSRIDFRQHFTATGEMIKEKADDLEDISQWLHSKAYINLYPWLFYLALFMSLVSVFMIVMLILDPSRFLLLLYPLWVARMARYRRREYGDPAAHALLYGCFCMLGKLPQLVGAGTFWWHRLRGRSAALIEYK